MAKSVQEMTEMFIKRGWSSNISFSELSMHEAEELGCLSIIAKMKKGKAFYKMAVSGNIYDENGHIVLFNLNPKLLPMMNKT